MQKKLSGYFERQHNKVKKYIFVFTYFTLWVMDIPRSYRGGTYTQHLSRKEIENMKKNMKKVPVIQLKTEIYHTKEIGEAEKILGNISSLQQELPIPPSPTKKTTTWYLSKFYSLRHRFISLF